MLRQSREEGSDSHAPEQRQQMSFSRRVLMSLTFCESVSASFSPACLKSRTGKLGRWLDAVCDKQPSPRREMCPRHYEVRCKRLVHCLWCLRRKKGSFPDCYRIFPEIQILTVILLSIRRLCVLGSGKISKANKARAEATINRHRRRDSCNRSAPRLSLLYRDSLCQGNVTQRK